MANELATVEEIVDVDSQVQQPEDGVYIGTIKQFVESGLNFKGKPVDVVAMSTLCRMGFFQQIGKAPNKQGKAPAVYLINFKQKKDFSLR